MKQAQKDKTNSRRARKRHVLCEIEVCNCKFKVEIQFTGAKQKFLSRLLGTLLLAALVTVTGCENRDGVGKLVASLFQLATKHSVPAQISNHNELH